MPRTLRRHQCSVSRNTAGSDLQVRVVRNNLPREEHISADSEELERGSGSSPFPLACSSRNNITFTRKDKSMKTSKIVILWLMALAMIVAACGSTSSTSPVTTPTSTPKLVLGDNLVTSITVATQSGTYHNPLDSTPDLMGTAIYFTATAPNGPGVFRVPAGGGAATELFVGKPFVSPRGIALGTNGEQLYVADPAAGQIFLLPISGGSPSPVPGS